MSIKKTYLYHLAFTLFVMAPNSTMTILTGRSFFSPRSQSIHDERQLVALEDKINLFSDIDYGAAYLMPLYSDSIRTWGISEYLFGGCNLVASGSRSPDRGNDDLLADYFGLPLDYESVLFFAPKITNKMLDFAVYFGLDSLHKGLYVRLHMPIVRTLWTLSMHEDIEDYGEQGYPAGYMASSALAPNLLMPTAANYFKGSEQVGDIQPLQYGKINGDRVHTGLSDVEFAIGWNPVINPEYHFGFNFRTSIPTGNHSHATWLFEPIVGNGGHWVFGVGFTGHSILVNSHDGEKNFAFYGDLNFEHLFRSAQKRSFDFKQNGAFSRYILIQEIGTPVVQGLVLGPDDTAAPAQYHGTLMPAINKTTLKSEVSITLQVEMVLKFSGTIRGCHIDFGYDLWARTPESLHSREVFQSNLFAIKGDAQMYGFTDTTPTQFVALDATQHEATMHAGQGAGNANLNFNNSNADSSSDPVTGDKAFASFVTSGGTESLNQAFGEPTAVLGSLTPVLLQNCDIDNVSALSPAAFSNTFFMHIDYSWLEFTNRRPSVGAGFEITFDGSNFRTHSALSEIAFWIKGGVSY